jgi:hypothetical protein
VQETPETPCVSGHGTHATSSAWTESCSGALRRQDNPSEEKYRRVRLSNQRFAAAVGRHPAGLAFLTALGFEEAAGFLELKRNDPGLLWLGKAALQENNPGV